MKILQISTYDTRGGSSRAALRLHRHFLAKGHEARLLVMQRYSHDSGVERVPLGWPRLTTMLSQKIDRWRTQQAAPISYWHTDRWPNGLAQIVNHWSVDVIHLHWVGDGFVPIGALPRLQAPRVWTLHDQWAFTGGCHLVGQCRRFQEQCGHCPQLAHSGENDLSRRTWRYKATSWQGLNLHLITPSQWMSQLVGQSSLLGAYPRQVIPYGLDTTVFRPREHKALRQKWGLKSEIPVILYGASHLNLTNPDDNKGGYLFMEALQKLQADGLKAQVLLFGGEVPPETTLPEGVHVMGSIQQEESLAELYALADVMVVPSRQENLPNTVMEALACATPVVAFAIGGISDMVKHQRNGYLACPYDTDDLALGIAWVLADAARHAQISQQARAQVMAHFNIEDITQQHLALYRSLITAST